MWSWRCHNKGKTKSILTQGPRYLREIIYFWCLLMCNNATHTNQCKATSFVFMLSFHGSENQSGHRNHDLPLLCIFLEAHKWRQKFGVTQLIECWKHLKASLLTHLGLRLRQREGLLIGVPIRGLFLWPGLPWNMTVQGFTWWFRAQKTERKLQSFLKPSLANHCVTPDVNHSSKQPQVSPDPSDSMKMPLLY